MIAKVTERTTQAAPAPIPLARETAGEGLGLALAPSRSAVTPRKCALQSGNSVRSEEHTSELQSLAYLVCRLLLEKKKQKIKGTLGIDGLDVPPAHVSGDE